MFRKLVGPSVLLAAAPVAAKDVKTQDESNKLAKYRPQDLPIYTTVFKNDSKRYTHNLTFSPHLADIISATKFTVHQHQMRIQRLFVHQSKVVLKLFVNSVVIR